MQWQIVIKEKVRVRNGLGNFTHIPGGLILKVNSILNKFFNGQLVHLYKICLGRDSKFGSRESNLSPRSFGTKRYLE